MPDPPPVTEERAFWRLPSASPVDVIHVTGSTELRAGLFDALVVSVIRGSRTEWRGPGGMHECTPDVVAMVAPGEVHRLVRIHRPVDYEVLIVSPTAVREAAEALGLPGGDLALARAQTTDRHLMHVVRRLHAAVAGRAPGLESDLALAETLRRVVETQTAAGRPVRTTVDHPGVRRARDYLHAHGNRNVPLEELSRAAGVSRFHLGRMFTRELGVSPHVYLSLLRLGTARRLLAAGAPISHAAFDAGYSDQPHLTREFRRAFGVTPGEYQRAHLGGAPRLPRRRRVR